MDKGQGVGCHSFARITNLVAVVLQLDEDPTRVPRSLRVSLVQISKQCCSRMGDAALRLSVSISAETTTDVYTTAYDFWLKVASPQGEYQGQPR